MKKKLFLCFLVVFSAVTAFADTTPAPSISIDPVGAHDTPFSGGSYIYDDVYVFEYMVTATGEGDVHLYFNGEEVSNPYYIAHEVESAYEQFDDEVWQFTATAQLEGCEMSETSLEYVSSGIPSYSLFHDEESESFWMEFGGNANFIRYKLSYTDPEDPYHWIFTDWEEYCGPFKVWSVPQDIVENNIMVEVYAGMSYEMVGNMGTIKRLKDEIDGFRIYQYNYYSDGFYFCYGTFDYDEGICNKFRDPQSHAPCYSGDLEIPDYVSVIHKQTFANCPDLNSIELPNSVNSIGRSAFSGCSGLKSITCKAITPPSTSSSFSDESIFDQAKLFVPNGSLEAYQAHEEWGRFMRIVPFIGAGPGDINGDGSIGMDDLTTIINGLLSNEELPAYNDVNGDGATSIDDLAVLINMLLTTE